MHTHTVRLPTRSSLQSSEGWAVTLLDDDHIEYTDGSAACLINTCYVAWDSRRQVYASESASPLFPGLTERLKVALDELEAEYVLI